MNEEFIALTFVTNSWNIYEILIQIKLFNQHLHHQTPSRLTVNLLMNYMVKDFNPSIIGGKHDFIESHQKYVSRQKNGLIFF
jgi:hypothetical protein